MPPHPGSAGSRPAPHVAGVILAAGSASRMGERKQLLPLAGRPLLAYAIAAARRTSLDPPLIVLGAASAEVRESVDLDGLIVIENADYAAGQSTSVHAGVRALPKQVDAALFILGDQPEVSPVAIERIVTTYRQTGAPIVQPRYAEGRGNPVLISRALFPELLALTGDVGARPLLRRHAEAITFADVSDLHRPEDIDTPEDYERLGRRFQAPISEGAP